MNNPENIEQSSSGIDQFRADFAPVFRSYNAMETTKRRHFDYMSMLEHKKKKFNLSATAEETLVLGNLLRDHNDEVHTFKRLSDALKNESPLAHQSLFEYIGSLNRALAPVSASAGH